MQRASESISKIAIALARAQAELENPEKSLTATIPSPVSAWGESLLSVCITCERT